MARQAILSLAKPAALSRDGQPPHHRATRSSRKNISSTEMLVENTERFIDSATSRIDLEWGHMVYAAPQMRRHGEVSTDKGQKGHVDSITRRMVVRHVYPRILYALSDVVCFVTSNGR